jgi:D-lactate dehydrogenase (cytochrome)
MSLIHPWDPQYDGFLRDESRRVGTADGIALPICEAEVRAIVGDAAAAGRPLTVQGARTGIAAGAVPAGGVVLSLARMKGIDAIVPDPQTGAPTLTVEPGVLLTEVRAVVEPAGLFFPPDPTETSASLGGMVACNASGALTFAYGPTRDWIQALRVVLADGSVLALRRGERIAAAGHFAVTTEEGRTIDGVLPGYTQPAVKSAAGYFITPDMDLLDLFIGMEGTLGVITEITCKLIPRPPAIAGLTLFLPSEAAALSAVRALRGEEIAGLPTPTLRPMAIEFFSQEVLDLLRGARAESPAFERIPVLRPHFHTALYVEFHGDDPDALEAGVMETLELAMALGGNDEDTWYATTPRELDPLKAFRHATPEAVNLLIDVRKRAHPGLTKLGTDMSVPDADLERVLALYRAGLAREGLESVIFGHIGNNHLHVNILPRDLADYERGKALYLDWARTIVAWGGSVAAEHGIGKLKVPMLRLMYGDAGIAQMQALKALFDPQGLFNPGNLF